MGHIVTTGAIDCDVHPAVPGMKALLPYFDSHWQEVIDARGVDGLDLAYYPPNAPVSARPDWRVAGRKPGSTLADMQSQALDAFGISRAICNCLYGGPAMYSADLSAAICRATNAWIAAEWLDKDDRLRASIVIPVQNTELAVDEIERWASDRRFVQILLLGAHESLSRLSPPLANLQGGREARPAHRHPCRQRHAPCTHGEWLALDPLRGACELHAHLPEPAPQPYRRRRLHQVPLAARGAAGIRHRLAPELLLARREDVAGMRKEIPWVDASPAAIVRDRVRFSCRPGTCRRSRRSSTSSSSKSTRTTSSSSPPTTHTGASTAAILRLEVYRRNWSARPCAKRHWPPIPASGRPCDEQFHPSGAGQSQDRRHQPRRLRHPSDRAVHEGSAPLYVVALA